jgi:Tol biopolymer transport system component
MRKISRFLKPASFGLALALALCLMQSAAAAGTMISFAASQYGEVKNFQVTSTGHYAVFSTLETSFAPHLFSVALDGGTPISLTTSLPPESNSYMMPYQISPDGSRVVYIARQEIPTDYSVYSVPITGGVPIRLSKTGLDGIRIAISPDSKWVFFVMYDDINFNFHLYRAALNGGTGSGVDITPPGKIIRDIFPFQISTDSQHYLFYGDLTPSVGKGIFCFPISGDGSQYVRLSEPVTNNEVMEFQITPDSQRLVYRAVDDSTNPATPRLYTVLLSGLAFSRRDLSRIIVSGGGVQEGFQISPNGKYVVFGADKEVTGKIELYSAVLEGQFIPLNPVQLNVVLDDTKDVSFHTLKISPDSAWVVYNANQNNAHDLFRVPIRGPIISNVKINQPISPTFLFIWEDNFGFSPDSSHIIFTSVQDSPDILDLYSIPVNGTPSDAIKINPTQVKNRFGYGLARNPVFSPDGRWIFYTAYIAKDRIDLLQSPAQGPANKSINLSSVSADDRSVSLFTLTPNHPKVVYSGQINSLQRELFLAGTQTTTFIPMVTR